MSPRIGRNASALVVEQSRSRQTARPDSTFRAILQGSADVLLSGASAASKVVGLPVVSAALSRAKAGSSDSSAAGTAASGDELLNKTLDQRYEDDLKLLALQSQIQRHNQQVSLVSNVMKSRHDTAKATISNMRA